MLGFLLKTLDDLLKHVIQSAFSQLLVISDLNSRFFGLLVLRWLARRWVVLSRKVSASATFYSAGFLRVGRTKKEEHMEEHMGRTQ